MIKTIIKLSSFTVDLPDVSKVFPECYIDICRELAFFNKKAFSCFQRLLIVLFMAQKYPSST